MFGGRFTRIEGLSDRRRLPRLGKIRLGVKVASKKGVEYPKEVDYFVVPPEVARVYGDKPKELDIMVPVNDLGVVFPQAYKWYGSQKGLKCIGDGVTAARLDEKTGVIVERECPCELLEKECFKRAHFMVILPKVSMGGVYQIDSGSYHSMVDINSGLEYVQILVGRFAMVPLKLRRVPRETHEGGAKRIHYPLQVTLDADINLLNRLREDNTRVLAGLSMLAIEGPVDENPALDEGAVVVEEEEGNGNGKGTEMPSKPETAPTPATASTSAPATRTSPKPAKKEKVPATTQQSKPAQATPSAAGSATPQQIAAIKALAAKRGVEVKTEGLSIEEASEIIKALQAGANKQETPQEPPQEVTVEEPW